MGQGSAAAKSQLCSPPQPKKTGTVWAARSHVIATVIWSGVRSLAYGVARLGPLAGPAVMMVLFSYAVYYLFTLLSPCLRTADPVNGRRTYTCKDALRSNLGLLPRLTTHRRLVGPLAPTKHSFSGGFKVVIRWCVQSLNLFGVAIGYTVAACISMMAVAGPDCSRRRKMRANPYMIAFGIAQIILSQIPDFNQLWWLSVVAAVASFTIETVAEVQRILRSFQHDGDVAFAYSQTLTKILDKLTSPLPSLNNPLLVRVATTTLFYLLFAIFSYAFFGDTENLFTGFRFPNVNWLEVIANLNVVFHLLGAYQAYCRPIFDFAEKSAAHRLPNSRFVTKEVEVAIPGFKPFDLNLFRLVFATVFVIVVTAISMALPLFDDIVALLCSERFWELTMYFPVAMYIVQMLLPLKF